tara:strand:+ start:720 stop:1634 length:915 start_codon:yes stop_codon:yes gene_type:complete
MSNNPHSLRANGWGYYPIDPKFKGEDFRKDMRPMFYTDKFDFSKSYLLIGCEPDRMFKPGTEPKDLDFFWWDNSMLPWLRYITPANGSGHKLWSRLTYRGWSMPEDSPALEEHRARVNRTLHRESTGQIKDIAQLWNGCKATRPIQNKRALIVASSQRNHREFYNQTQFEWIQMITEQLKQMGWTYEVRQKVPIKQRPSNQIVHQMERGKFDVLIGNHTAGTSEAVVIGYPVITTSEWNPARSVSTTWEDFCQGKITEYTEKQIDHWVTRICAYTYYRSELNSLSWIDHHPQAQHLKEKRYDIR